MCVGPEVGNFCEGVLVNIVVRQRVDVIEQRVNWFNRFTLASDGVTWQGQGTSTSPGQTSTSCDRRWASESCVNGTRPTPARPDARVARIENTPTVVT